MQLGKNAGLAIAVGAVVTGLLIHNILKGGTSSGPGQRTAAAASYSSPEDEALSAKLQPFISCINSTDATLQQRILEYHKVVEILSADPTDSKYQASRLFWGYFKIKPYEVDNQFTKECVKGLRSGIAMKPTDAELDAAGKAYAETLEQAIPLMNAANTYYDHKDHKDDKMQKGKEIDAQLTPLLDQLVTASGKIRDRVHSHNNTLRERELAAMEKQEGKTFNWQMLNFMFQARRAMDELHDLAGADKLSTEKLQAVEQKLQAALDEGKAYAAAHSGEKTALGNQPAWFFIERNADSLVTAVKELRRNIADQKQQQSIDGDFKRIIDDFNTLVSNYNMRIRYN